MNKLFSQVKQTTSLLPEGLSGDNSDVKREVEGGNSEQNSQSAYHSIMNTNHNSPDKNSHALTEGSATIFSDGDIEYSLEDEAGEQAKPKKCLAVRACCHKTFKPLQTKYNPLPDSPGICDRFKYFFLCPPHGKVGGFMLLVLMFAVWMAVLISLTGEEALPGGNLFALMVLFIACWLGGYLVGLVKNVIPFLPLPPLLGMLLVGGILRNVDAIGIAEDIHPSWSGGARNIALGIILLRAGLGLDPKALRKLSFVVIRLAFSPCLMETLADAVASHFLLGLPWAWAFMLGFVIAAVSPAVVVPCLLGLQEQGYGVDKGIPTLVIAAASIDDVLAITGFGVVLGIAFSQGNLVWTLLKGPIEALVGVILGIIMGILLWYFPQKSSQNLTLFRSVLLVGFGLMSIFLSQFLEWAGAGPLGCLTLAFVAALHWREEFAEGEKNPMEDVVGVLWMIFQPLLFGLIGAEVELASININTIGLGLATLGIGLAIRMVVSFLSVFRTNLNLKERFFIPFAWLPKATVQAAIGAKALDIAISQEKPELIALGKQVLTIAVLSILVTAPIGSALVMIFGPRLLKKSPVGKKSIDVASSDHDAMETGSQLNPGYISDENTEPVETSNRKEDVNDVEDIEAKRTSVEKEEGESDVHKNYMEAIGGYNGSRDREDNEGFTRL